MGCWHNNFLRKLFFLSLKCIGLSRGDCYLRDGPAGPRRPRHKTQQKKKYHKQVRLDAESRNDALVKKRTVLQVRRLKGGVRGGYPLEALFYFSSFFFSFFFFAFFDCFSDFSFLVFFLLIFF